MGENRIKEFREKIGMSQSELARKVKVASPNISSVERGRMEAWPRLRRALARVLKTTPEELFPPGQMETTQNGNSEALTISLEEAAKRLGIGRALAYRLAFLRKISGLSTPWFSLPR